MTRRTLGPFSGGQLTIIAVALILAIGLPGSVFAVSRLTKVAIKDPKSHKVAAVDKSHRLKTLATVKGPVATTVNNDVGVHGSVGATINGGSSKATESSPANLVSFFVIATGACTPAYTPPSGKAIVLKAATGNLNGSSPETDLFRDSSCNHIVAAFTAAGPRDSVNETFGSGVAFGALYVKTFAGGGSINGYGYLIPAGALSGSASKRAAPRAGSFRGVSAR